MNIWTVQIEDQNADRSESAFVLTVGKSLDDVSEAADLPVGSRIVTASWLGESRNTLALMGEHP